jgi:hypothetical protein
MKKYNYHICGLLIVALVWFTFSGCQTSTTLNVSIDGAQVATLVEGRSYNGTLSAGRHVLTLSVDPNLGGIPPTTKRLTVQKGQTYSFTAMWSGQRLVLR